MERLTLRAADLQDIQMLTEMNQELIQDEKSDNRMSFPELYERMTEFLTQEWNAVLLVIHDAVIGYALYKEKPLSDEIYLRQFFVKKEYRGRGWGRQGIHLLMTEVFPPTSTCSLDVLESNPQGRKFWESIGFQPYYTNMKLRSIRA